jgi:predicted DNA-binding mobile mystery protein A
MPNWAQARQARRLLDDKYVDGTLAAIRVPPRSGWIKAVRVGLGMSQDSLARRLGISRAAVTQLEHAEREGAITLAKLSEVASALGCTLVYALVPDVPLEQTVHDQAARVVDHQLGYVNTTMALEGQAVEAGHQDDLRAEAIEAAIRRGDIWRAP